MLLKPSPNRLSMMGIGLYNEKAAHWKMDRDCELSATGSSEWQPWETAGRRSSASCHSL